MRTMQLSGTYASVRKNTGLTPAAPKHRSNNPDSEFRFVLIIAFSLFFVAIALGRLVPRRWRWNISGHDQEKSIFGAAKSAAYTTIPFAFM